TVFVNFRIFMEFILCRFRQRS
ncbi:FAD-binding protein, partial [Escherichia coli]|nr:FAD-binding protein [Escherichia coli]EFC1501002.1 FAD-binding protein [Escherichia coli]EFH9221265.1 FAD-binding protein [Escherichia coli]